MLFEGDWSSETIFAVYAAYNNENVKKMKNWEVDKERENDFFFRCWFFRFLCRVQICKNVEMEEKKTKLSDIICRLSCTTLISSRRRLTHHYDFTGRHIWLRGRVHLTNCRYRWHHRIAKANLLNLRWAISVLSIVVSFDVVRFSFRCEEKESGADSEEYQAWDPHIWPEWKCIDVRHWRN